MGRTYAANQGGIAVKRVRQLNDWLLKEELAREDLAVAVLLYSVGQPSNGRLIRQFRSVAEEYIDVVRFFRIDVTENPSVREALPIRVLPTIVLYADGKERARREGPQNENDIRALIVGKPEKLT